MADSTTILDEISSSQSSKEVTANALFDAMSANALFGRRASTTTLLTWGYYGGVWKQADGTLVAIDNGTIALTDDATNYIYTTDAGIVTKVTVEPSGWPDALLLDAVAIYEVVTADSAVDSYTDWRSTRGLPGGTGPQGEQGIQGEQGEQGIQGDPGAAGDTGLTTKGDLLTFDTAGVRLGVGSNDELLVADSADSKGIKWWNLGLLFNAKTAKTTPVDADMFGLMDSAASNVLKKLSWANLKATLWATVGVYTKNQSVTPVALVDGANIAVDASLSNNFSVTLGGNRTLDNPTNLTAGMVLNFTIDQDGTGSRTLAYGNLYKFPGGTHVLSTTANAKDLISAYYDGTVLRCNLVKAFS